MSRRPRKHPDRKRRLSDLEEAYVREYLVDLCAGKAVRRAGYTTKYPDQQGYELMGRPHVIEAIGKAMAKRSQATEITATWVLAELAIQYNRAKDAAGTGKESRPAERGHAIRALEKIGDHVDVNAFRKQFGVGNPDGSTFDFAGLSDDELDSLESILSKAAIAGADTSGEDAPGG